MMRVHCTILFPEATMIFGRSFEIGLTFNRNQIYFELLIFQNSRVYLLYFRRNFGL